MLIGLVGRNAAGKGTIAEYLKKKGFGYFSLSDELREEARKRRISETRENMIELGNSLRRELGAGVLSERVEKKLDQTRNCVIDSIRNPAEAVVFKKRSDFVLWFVDAKQKTRFERLKKRGRPGDPTAFEEFKWLEEAEEKGKLASSQNISKTIQMVDVAVKNDSSFENLYKNVDKALEKKTQNFERPSWDEYFMNVAHTVASRSNCVKRKVAAIVVKDKRIISTGYNGTPRGVKNCNEGGCPRCNSFADSGTKLEECVCSHGEENAIVQASYHGVALLGSTLYTTYCPCLLCAKMIINSGIKKVVYKAEYRLNDTAKKILKEAKVKLVKYEG